MIDDGAPYSDIGSIKLQLLRGSTKVELRPLSDSIKYLTFWQLGFGAHACTAKPILGSSMLRFMSDNGRPIEICHIIVAGSSSWVLGRNITRVWEIRHVGANCVRFPPNYG